MGKGLKGLQLGRFILSLGAFFCLIFIFGCTRNKAKENVRLVIPLSSHKSSLAVGDLLKHAIVNIQVPGRSLPLVQEFNFESNPVSWGTPLDLTINDVPQGTGLLIQFLGVFETAAGASYLITYGDTLANIVSGQNIINLSASAAGTANREGRVAGRYFNQTSPATTGPTGTLLAYFYPPNGKPRMNVEKSSIISGWFNIFVLDNIPMTYVLAETGEEIFTSLTINSSSLATGTQVLHVGAPSYYRRQQKNSTTEVRLQVASDFFLGFFKASGLSLSLSSYNVCYANNLQEGLPGWYGAYDGATGKFSQPLKYDSVAGGASDLTPLAGGSAVSSYSSWALNQTCDPANTNQLVYYHHRTNDGGEGFGGIKPPFRLIDPFVVRGGFLRKIYNATSSRIELYWKYLPGTSPVDTGSGLSGVDILVRTLSGSTSMSFSGHSTCDTLLSQGYSVAGSLTTSAESYFYQNANLTSINQWNYTFAMCGFKSDAAGNKKYLGEIVFSDCGGMNCGEMEHYGWGVTAGNITTAGSAESVMGVHHARITLVDGTSSDLYTIANLDTGTYDFTTGDTGGEVLISVLGEGAITNCGNYQGQNIAPGMKTFARLLSASASVIKIPKGTFLDELNNTYLGTASTTTDFCYVVATKVPHYTNLNLAAAVTSGSFNYSQSGGGILPFRVSGDLSIASGASLSASASGFAAGGSPSTGGAGFRSASGVSWITGNSGGSTLSGLSGGGAGPLSYGGPGISSLGIQNGSHGGGPSFNSGGNVQMMLGGGGGGYGGAGGGILFVAARYLSSVGGVLNSSGANKVTGASGGGGGGTIVLLSEKASGTLSILAQGGSSSNLYTPSGEGGAGGGGVFYNLMCSSTGLTLSTNVAAGTGPASANTIDGAGDGQVFQATTALGYNPACQN